MPHKRKGSSSWYISIRTPGWRRDRLNLALHSGVRTKSGADKYEEALRSVFASGHWEALDALVDGHIGITSLYRKVRKRGGLDQLPKWVEEQVREKAPVTAVTGDLIDEWLISGRSKASKRQKKRYRAQVLGFVEWLEAHIVRKGQVATVEDFSRRNVERWQAWFMESRLPDDLEEEDEKGVTVEDSENSVETSPAYQAVGRTCNRHFAAIRAFTRWLYDEQYISEHRVSRSAIQGFDETPSQEVALASSEVKVLLRIAQDRDRERGDDGHPFPDALFWEVLIATGALVHQECARQLTLGNIRWDREDDGYVPLHIRGTKSKNRHRSVPIPMELASRLRRHCDRYNIDADELIFARPARGAARGVRKPFSSWLTSVEWRRLRAQVVEIRRKEGADKTELKRWQEVLAQHLRHTYARSLMESGHNLRQVAYYMGHGSNLKTTERYLVYRPSLDTKLMKRAHQRTILADEVDAAPKVEKEALIERLLEDAERLGIRPEDLRDALG